MIQGGPGANNWRNIGPMHYESYVLEVQELIDRMLPTIPARSARAIAGDSMGGYGAMNVALGNPFRFAVVESWLGFFNGLGDELRADRPIIARLGLHAFLYGGDPTKSPTPPRTLPSPPPCALPARTPPASSTPATTAWKHSRPT